MVKKVYCSYKTGDILVSKTNINIRDWGNIIVATIPKGSVFKVTSSNREAPDRPQTYDSRYSYVCGEFIKYPDINQNIFYKYQFSNLEPYDPNQEPEDDAL